MMSEMALPAAAAAAAAALPSLLLLAVVVVAAADSTTIASVDRSTPRFIIIIDTSRVGPQAAALGNLPQTAPGKVGPQPFLSTASAQPLSSPFRPLLLALPNLSSPGLHSPASVLVDQHVPCHHLPTQTRLPRRRRLLSRAMRCDRERRSCASWSDPD